MSRLERNKERREKLKKRRFIYKVIFILSMSFLTSICLLIVDFNANAMLGNESFIENSLDSFKNVQPYINKLLNYVKLN